MTKTLTVYFWLSGCTLDTFWQCLTTFFKFSPTFWIQEVPNDLEKVFKRHLRDVNFEESLDDSRCVIQSLPFSRGWYNFQLLSRWELFLELFVHLWGQLAKEIQLVPENELSKNALYVTWAVMCTKCSLDIFFGAASNFFVVFFFCLGTWFCK